jgi:hypothetical protein
VIVFSSAFVAEPEIFSYEGNWLENEVFPQLARKRALYGYLSSIGGAHVHSKEDIPIIRTWIGNN